MGNYPVAPAVAATTWSLGDGFEGKVLAVALRDEGFLSAYSDVFSPRYFEHECLITLARLVDDYFRKYGAVPSRDVVVSLVNDYTQKYGGTRTAELYTNLSKWLDWIYQVDLVSDLDFVRETVVSFAQRQALKGAVSRVLDILDSPSGDVTKARFYVDEALRVGSTRDLGMDFGPTCLSIPELLQSDATYGAANKVPTGISVLDESLSGGFGAGELCTIMALPGTGKSTLMVNVGKAALYHFMQRDDPRAVIHLTLELKEHDVALKYASAFTGLTFSEVQAGGDEYTSKIEPFVSRIGNSLRIKYFSPGSVTVEEVYWYIANLLSSEELRAGLVIIDYADLLSVNEKSGRYEEMGRVYKELISLGDKLKCPVVTGCQIGRAYMKEELIGPEGAADSWRKVEASDCVLSINQSLIEHEQGGLRLFLGKVRRGQKHGIIYCNAQFGRGLIWEMTPDQVEDFKGRVKEARKQQGVPAKNGSS